MDPMENEKLQDVNPNKRQMSNPTIKLVNRKISELEERGFKVVYRNKAGTLLKHPVTEKECIVDGYAKVSWRTT